MSRTSAACLLLLLSLTARADVAPPAPVAERVARVQAVVVGKVTAIEEKTVQATPYPGAEQKVEHAVAVVKIDEALNGAKGLTHLKVGFLPVANRRFPQMKLTVGQEACFFLAPHEEGGFHVTRMYYDITDRKTPTFEKDVAEARRCAKLLAEPEAGLKSKDAADRYLTAAMLIVRYRTPVPSAGEPRQEPIDAAQSKLILRGLLDGDWSRREPFRLSAFEAFNRLGLTPEDGWTPPGDFTKFADAAKQWLKDHADTYRVKRFVADTKE
jgi:hypothetical protein